MVANASSSRFKSHLAKPAFRVGQSAFEKGDHLRLTQPPEACKPDTGIAKQR